MKIRNGFVSNSSSSSFIINIKDKKEIDFSEIIDWEYTRTKEDEPVFNEDLINNHLNYAFSKISPINLKIRAASRYIKYEDPLYSEISYVRHNMNEVEALEFYEKYKDKIEELWDDHLSYNDSDTLIIGEMEDNDKIEKLIHNSDLYFKDEFEYATISNH